MKYIRKRNHLNEGFFKNPEQARVARAKEKERSNTEVIADIASSTITVPALKKFLCESAEFREEFSKTALYYVDGNQGNSMYFSKFTHPYATVSSWNHNGIPMFYDTFMEDKVKCAKEGRGSLFVITDVQVVNKDLSKGIITVDLNAIISTRITTNSNLFFYSYIVLGNSSVFKGKPGREDAIKTEISKSLTTAYKHSLARYKAEEASLMTEGELNALSDIKSIRVNKIYMYKNIPKTITTVTSMGLKRTNAVNCFGDAQPRFAREGIGAAYLVFPMYNYKEQYDEQPLKKGEVAMSIVNENTLIENFGGALNVFDFNHTDFTFYVNAFINCMYSVPNTDVIKKYLESVSEYCTKTKQLYSNVGVDRSLVQMSYTEKDLNVIYCFVAKMQYILKNNKLVPSEYHQTFAKLLSALSDAKYTDMFNDTVITKYGSVKSSKISDLMQFHSSQGYFDIYTSFIRAFVTTDSNLSMDNLKETKLSFIPTENMFPLFPNKTNIDVWDNEVISIYNFQCYNFNIPPTPKFINSFMPYFSLGETADGKRKTLSGPVAYPSDKTEELIKREIGCRRLLHDSLYDAFKKIFKKLGK